MAINDERKVRCSFCGKHPDQVKRMIAGPGVYICNECVNLCMEAMGAEPLVLDDLVIKLSRSQSAVTTSIGLPVFSERM